MKRKYIILILSASMSVSCTDITINNDKRGTNPDSRDTYTSLCAERVTGQSIAMTLTLGETADSEEADLYIRSSLPFEKSGTVWLDFAGEDFVKEYSESKGIEYRLLPAAYYKFRYGNSIEISSGGMESDRNSLTVSTKDMFGNIIAPGRYLLPVIADGTGICELDKNTVLIDLTVREPYTDPDGYELYTGKDLVTIFYVNTSMFDPRLANDMVIMTDWGDDSKPQYGIGNIINLLTANVQIDDISGRVFANPSLDLRYCLEHYTERILPVQESGRKVCITIEGGGKGLGFCNFDDTQIASFVASVSKLVEKYGLDGVNLWDRNSNYEHAEENGFAPMNTTSYPKLVKALRENLGEHKLITITDYEKPTAYFNDITVCGGIEVGKHIDYAWSGYYDNREPFQVIDPWNQRLETVSSLHPRQPFAGLDRNLYGCIHGVPRKYDSSLETAQKWSNDGYFNGIVVFYNLRSIIQDQYEGNYQFPGTLIGFIYDSNMDQNIKRLTNHNGTGTSAFYGKWLKDW